MQPTMILLFAACICGLVMLTWTLRASLHRRRIRRVEAGRMDAYRRLYDGMQSRKHQAHFSYRPATQELVIDARTARMHGLDMPGTGLWSEITLTGWHQLPAAARAAGWIDEALADGLNQEKPVCCEYLARLNGRPDLHVMLTAMPAPQAGLLVGVLAERPRAIGAG